SSCRSWTWDGAKAGSTLPPSLSRSRLYSLGVPRRRARRNCVNNLLAQQSLLVHLIRGAALRASAMLADPLEAARLRTPSDCGMTEIERLEHSVLAEDQLLAAALRLTAGPAASAAIEAALHNCFATPPARLAVEAQRRAVFKTAKGLPLPSSSARRAASEIEA